jgi:alkanesulfonate monooxygenase SsuD/methylene tetrahydromethanopterin reductase-like flavin-dependent oxidoreductase (luciferase family)
LFLPAFAEFADPRRVVRLAVAAEDAGWEGLFLWDHVLAIPGMAVADAWVTLSAVAMATSRLRIGALVTPLNRRRPWVIARQIATLDHLSGGRLVVGVGIGDDDWKEFSSFGEVTGQVARGELLDESLAVLRQLLTGQPVDYEGKRLSVHSGPFLPRPLQDPVPIWGACRWPNRRPLKRAAHLEGCFVIFPAREVTPPSPSEVAAVREQLDRLGAPAGSDLVVRCVMPRGGPAVLEETVASLEQAGATWILESFGPGEPPASEIEATVAAGPPRH